MTNKKAIPRASRSLRPVLGFANSVKVVKKLINRDSEEEILKFISECGVEIETIKTGRCERDGGLIGYHLLTKNNKSCRMSFCCTGMYIPNSDNTKADPWYGSIN